MVAKSSLKCWSCGAEHGAAARFCSVCGVRLAAPDPRSQPRGSNQAETVVERRQLTVMFCDLVGSTKLSLALDPEDYTNIVSAYRDACVRVVRQHKGYIARYVGDGVLSYFGYPKASEDDALRAAGAAWELSQSIPAVNLSNAGLGSGISADVSLQVRIGLHTGLALVGEIAGDESSEIDAVSGAVPNIAAKLQALARPGEVVISDATAKLLPSIVPRRALQRRGAHAEAATVKPYLLTGFPQQFVGRRPVTADCFVGRATLMARVISSIEHGDSQSVKYLFLGEPGIGKSRFVREVIRHPAAAGVSWIELACNPHGQASALHPFRGLIAESDREGVDSGAASSSSGAATDELSPFQRRRRTFERLKSAILAHAPRVGLVLEDMHWADPTSRDFVAELLSSGAAAGVTLLMTSRALPDGEIARSNRLCVEALDRLLPGEAAELAKSTSGTRALSTFELAEIVDRADGVPLYLEEFVRAVADADIAPERSNEGRIPATLRDSLMGRLDGLGAGRTVALQASVLGRHFDYRHLCTLLEFNQQELSASLHALTNVGILLQSGVIPDATFGFRHALLRDIAYQTLLKSDRERLHRRFAQLASDGMFGKEEAMPELLAIHHSLGGNLSEAIGYWLKAGREAIKRSANAEALDHISRGLDDCRALAKSDRAAAAQAELQFLSTLPAPLIAVSGWSSPELERVYRRAMELCAEVGSKEAEFDLARGRYNLHLLKSEIKTASAIADDLLRASQSTPADASHKARLIEALRAKALTEFYQARYAQARTLLDQMMALYDPTVHAIHAYQYGAEPAAVALSYLAWMDSLAGQDAASKARLEKALEHASAAEHAFSVCYVHCFAASCAQLWAAPQLAAAYADEAIHLANQHNFQYWLAWGRALRGWVVGIDAPAKGIQAVEEARAAYLATGSSLVAPYFEALACNIGRHGNIGGTAERERAIAQRTQATGVQFWREPLEIALRSPAGVSLQG